MRDPKRIKRIITKLYRLWEMNPDWRLGQLISNAANMSTDKAVYDVFPVEDDITEDGLNRLLIISIKNKKK
jgi:hypothetical protein